MLSVQSRWLFVLLLPVFLVLAYVIDGIVFEYATLTLLASSLVLYVLFVAYSAAGQKRRIAKLHGAIRSEANALFDILVQSRKLPEKSRQRIQDLAAEYMTASFRQRRPAEGAHEYEHLISYCLEYRGKDPDTIGAILATLSANQTNRSKLAVQLGARVTGSEWLLACALLVLSLGFVLTLNTVNPAGQAAQAVVCTALSIQLFNLAKLSTLTHKTAARIWQPLHTLNTARFRRFD